MSFLVENDYKTLVADEDLDIIQNSDALIRADAEKFAEDELKGYLRARYDVDFEFAQIGSARKPLLIMYMVDMSLYHLHARIPGRFVTETRTDRYNHVIKELDKIRKGDVVPDLKYKDEEDSGNPIAWGNMEYDY